MHITNLKIGEDEYYIIQRKGSWRNVSIPDTDFSYIPFDIQQNGTVFRPAPSFDLRTHANISVTKTYYVDKTIGNDAWAGDSYEAGHPLKTIAAAYAKPDVDRIRVRNSYFLKSECLPTSISRSMEIIADDENVYLTADMANKLGTWSQVDNYWVSDLAGGEFIARVYDRANLNSFGHWSTLTNRASIAEVNANPGSWYLSAVGGFLYVRTIDDRQPDGDILCYDSVVGTVYKDNLKIYYEGINHRHGGSTGNASATGGAKTYYKNCTLFSVSPRGLNEVILQNCYVYKSGDDGINYDSRNGIVTKSIEIDCEVFDGGASTTNQCSTTHNGCLVVRINGKYHDFTGQQIADTGTGGKTWMLGSEVYNAPSVGIYSTVTMWLDSVWCHDNGTYNLQNTSGNTIYYRNLRLEGVANDIGGSFTEY